MRLSPSGARSAAAILFDHSMCQPVADGIEVLARGCHLLHDFKYNLSPDCPIIHAIVCDFVKPEKPGQLSVID
jgi:hypothetical protein